MTARAETPVACNAPLAEVRTLVRAASQALERNDSARAVPGLRDAVRLLIQLHFELFVDGCGSETQARACREACHSLNDAVLLPSTVAVRKADLACESLAAALGVAS